MGRRNAKQGGDQGRQTHKMTSNLGKIKSLGRLGNFSCPFFWHPKSTVLEAFDGQNLDFEHEKRPFGENPSFPMTISAEPSLVC